MLPQTNHTAHIGTVIANNQFPSTFKLMPIDNVSIFSRLLRHQRHESQLGTERAEASVLRPAQEVLADHHNRRCHHHHCSSYATHRIVLLLLPMCRRLRWTITTVR